MRGKALQKLGGGLYEVQWNVFFFFLPEYSTNFLIKDKDMDRDVLQKHVWKWVDGELEHMQI